MKRHASMAAGLLVSLLAGTARADLTVFYTTDGPAGPLVASASGRAPEEPRPDTTPAAHLPERSASREVLFVRVGDGSGEEDRIMLLDAHGAPSADAIDRLSILARPRGVAAPRERASDDPELVAPGIRRLHPGLVVRLARIAERFPDRGIEIVSGYRPDAREGSRHRHARALDLRVRGEGIEQVRRFLEAQAETGVGFYPTSGFLHVDVRTESAHWVDRSGPGEPPSIVREGETDAPSAAPSEATPSDAMAGDEPTSETSIEETRRAIEALEIDLDLGL